DREGAGRPCRPLALPRQHLSGRDGALGGDRACWRNATPWRRAAGNPQNDGPLRRDWRRAGRRPARHGPRANIAQKFRPYRLRRLRACRGGRPDRAWRRGRLSVGSVPERKFARRGRTALIVLARLVAGRTRPAPPTRGEGESRALLFLVRRLMLRRRRRFDL